MVDLIDVSIAPHGDSVVLVLPSAPKPAELPSEEANKAAECLIALMEQYHPETLKNGCVEPVSDFKAVEVSIAKDQTLTYITPYHTDIDHSGEVIKVFVPYGSVPAFIKQLKGAL